MGFSFSIYYLSCEREIALEISFLFPRVLAPSTGEYLWFGFTRALNETVCAIRVCLNNCYLLHGPCEAQ